MDFGTSGVFVGNKIPLMMMVVAKVSMTTMKKEEVDAVDYGVRKIEYFGGVKREPLMDYYLMHY